MVEQPMELERALGEVMTEPKPRVWFDEPDEPWQTGAVALDRRTRMLYDDHHIFINGEAFRAGGRDARLMRQLADQRGLPAAAVKRASDAAQALLADWFDAGWVRRV
jgi:50S ribosomal protein L16 3-hydroxylase